MRWGVAALAGLALTVSVAGCGGSSRSADPSSPVPLSVHTPAEDSSASATPTLDPNSDAAILAAVQAYAAAVTAVARTASTAPLEQIVDPSCACMSSLESLASQLHQKNWHEDVRITTDEAKILRRNSTNADVSVKLTNPPFHVLESDGALIETGKAASIPTVLSFERKGAIWLVFNVDGAS